jgi:hypothetical protein
MKTTLEKKIKFWLDRDSTLKDNDLRLTANIWHTELAQLGGVKEDFLKFYASGKVSQAPSIKRERARIQELEPKYRGLKYAKRQGEYQDKWKKDLGYD